MLLLCLNSVLFAFLFYSNISILVTHVFRRHLYKRQFLIKLIVFDFLSRIFRDISLSNS